MNTQQIHETIYRVSGPDLSDERDCAAYLIDTGEPVLIDCGSGFAHNSVIANIRKAGYEPEQISSLILTHCHYDHIGGAHLFKSDFGTTLRMHTLDADIVQRADQMLTAAFCFNTLFQPLTIDIIIRKKEERLIFGKQQITVLHTPGHTPGSISLYMDFEGTRIVFVQDIGAPLLKDFHCDAAAWKNSVEKLIAVDADILCDGHAGAFAPKRNVRRYLEMCIQSQVKQGYFK